MAEGLLLSGRMLKDHLLGAVLEGLDGAMESSKQAGEASRHQGGSPSSPSSPSGGESGPRGLHRKLEDTGRAVGQGITGAGDVKALLQ